MEFYKGQSIDFLKELIKKDSVNPPGNELVVAKTIIKRAQELGLKTEVHKINNSRENLVIRLSGNNEKPELAFCGHMDTVGIGKMKWKFDPFSGQIDDRKMYGRGASDMKSGLAAMIESMGVLKKQQEKYKEMEVGMGDVILIATVGEEVDCSGAIQIKEKHILDNVGAMVIGEPTNQRVVITHKGAIWIKITAYGKTSHASMPDLGINAILQMEKIIKILENNFLDDETENSLLGRPTMNIGRINGGIQPNVVPDECEMVIDIRTLPGTNHSSIIDKLKKSIAKLNISYSLDVLHNLTPLDTPENNWFVRKAVELNSKMIGSPEEVDGINFYTDGSIFCDSYDFPIIVYGPGKRELAHQPNEYIELDKYVQAIDYYVEIAKLYYKNYEDH